MKPANLQTLETISAELTNAQSATGLLETCARMLRETATRASGADTPAQAEQAWDEVDVIALALTGLHKEISGHTDDMETAIIKMQKGGQQ